ncbi:phosphatidylinositol-glycan biosynthesis class S protein [Neohortaea acidophila]|uniref:Phosphatidylinositol-glycan biosynthesis class S protein n=1 Tax=Neohortaea acidophila TaxID=245834 RepID=A0A6A6Q238_9PEZI|nr:phosphatidylinositol-glycan biosynthesis class S protein [Neohortaea acidophila]KAF2486578.1 phosphatidylinositol-glycan biosynthesis class S protein [Neohortaea acidophila]
MSSAKSSPPPEQGSFIWTRRLILFAFWGVVVVLGLPHWLWTTSIHRSQLPLESMNNWADGKVCRLQYPIHVKLRYEDAGFDETNALAAETQHVLNALNQLPLYQFHITGDLANASSEQALLPSHVRDTLASRENSLIVNIQNDKKIKTPQAALKSLIPVLDVRHNPARTGDSLTAFLAREISKVFSHEQNYMHHLLQETPFESKEYVNRFSPEVKAGLDARTTRAFKYASTYHLTFSLFVASSSPSAWNIQQALEDGIYPLIERLSPVNRFTIDTQIQLYASFSPSIAGPQYNPITREWQLQRPDLSGFINAAEWPLSPSIGSGPTINFVLYVPSKHQSPLVLAETGGQSWIVPQWGGVQIFNPADKQVDQLTAEDLRPAMLTFADQLSTLVGLPPSPSSLSLRISGLTRERTTSLILSASSTLGALSRLTLKLTSIAIPDSVAKSVSETIHRLDQACQHMQDGRYLSALENARTAEEEAEKAFFEPSMVGQVYFPEEHKVAVYVPLLGPMAVPLVLSAIKELKKLRERKVKVA